MRKVAVGWIVSQRRPRVEKIKPFVAICVCSGHDAGEEKKVAILKSQEIS